MEDQVARSQGTRTPEPFGMNLRLDVRDALGPGAADLADEPGEHHDRDDIRGHQQQVRLDRRVEGGQDRLQLRCEPEQERRPDRAERRIPPEDHRGERDVALAGGHVRAERADRADREEGAADACYQAGRDHVAVPHRDHRDAHGVGRGRVLADGPGAQPPPGGEQAYLDASQRDVGDVQEDGGVEEDRADDRDVAEQRDPDRGERGRRVQRVAVGHHEAVIEVPGDAEDQRVEHHAEDDLVHPVADGEDGEQHRDQRAGQRSAYEAQPQRAGDAGHDGGGEGAEQQLALDADVDHPDRMASSTATSEPASAPHTRPSHSEPVTLDTMAAVKAPSSSWPSMPTLITPEREHTTPVSAPSMIGIESLNVPCSWFTTLNDVASPASAQHSKARTSKKMTTPMVTRRSVTPNGRKARSAAIARLSAPHT